MFLLQCGACVGFFGMTFYGRGVVRSFSIVACLSGHKGADGRLVVDQSLVTPCPASLPRVRWKLHELPVIVFSDAGYNSRNATPAGDKEVEAAIPVIIMGPGLGAAYSMISMVFTCGLIWFQAS